MNQEWTNRGDLPCRVQKADNTGKPGLRSVGLEGDFRVEGTHPRHLADWGLGCVPEQRFLWLMSLVAKNGGAQLMTPELEAG